MIQSAAINLINKIIINKLPNSIFKLFKINRRSNVEIVTFYKPKTTKTENFFLYKALKMYNKIPKEIKTSKKFKGELKTHLTSSKAP